jgi:hypothetical protein
VVAPHRCARQIAVRAMELDVLDLEVPEMDDDLQACQRDAGCTGFSVSGRSTSSHADLYLRACMCDKIPN